MPDANVSALSATLRLALLQLLQESADRGEIPPLGGCPPDPLTGLVPVTAPPRLTVSLDTLQSMAVLAGWSELGDAFAEVSVDVAPAPVAEDAAQLH